MRTTSPFCFFLGLVFYLFSFFFLGGVVKNCSEWLCLPNFGCFLPPREKFKAFSGFMENPLVGKKAKVPTSKMQQRNENNLCPPPSQGLGETNRERTGLSA